jgi:two-component system, NtrC family, sensor kinase
MKLTSKIVLVFMIGIALLTLFHGYVTVQQEDQRLKMEMEQEAQSIGLAMEETVMIRWQELGQKGVIQLVQQADGRYQHMNIQWIAIDDALPVELPAELSGSQMQGLARGDVFSVISQTHQRVFYPINVASTTTGYIEFAEPLTEVHQHRRRMIYQTGTVLLGMLLCSCVVILLGIRMVGRPLEKLIDKTRRIGEGDFSGPIELHSHDEFSQLAEALNQMSSQLAEQQHRIQDESAARVAAVEQLRHADRLKTVGRLASGMAHELGTPLNVVSGRAELIASQRLDDEQVLESARAIKSESDRMATIIRQLLDFARRDSPRRSVVELGPIVKQSVALLETLAEKRNIELVFVGEADPSITANVDEGQIQQALTNLIVNAIQASPNGSSVQVGVGLEEVSPANQSDDDSILSCCLSVIDHGHGIAADDREHLFEPFFTTKDIGEGTGLGLSVAHGIVQDHDGWIDVTSGPDQGTCFTIYLPKA